MRGPLLKKPDEPADTAHARRTVRRPEIMTFLFWTAVVIASWYAFFFILSLCEKQYLAGDMEPASEPFPYKPSTYWLATRELARSTGLICVGTYATKRNTSWIKGLESVWVPPDRTIAVSIVSASFCGLTIKKTSLRTRLSDGRVLESTDTSTPNDPTGLVQSKLLLNAKPSELLTFHRQRLAQSGVEPLPFLKPDVYAELEQIQLERGRSLVEMGLARWINREQTILRSTMPGVVRAMFRSGQWRQMQDQQGRMDLRRAGT